jgi:hypothetical protein
MTTTELIKWAMHAANKRELSWNKHQKRYDLNLLQAVVITTLTTGASSTERDICFTLLNHCWNEVQGWNYKLSLSQQVA